MQVGGLILRGPGGTKCAKHFEMLIIFIAQIVAISACYRYLGDNKPTHGWQRAQ